MKSVKMSCFAPILIVFMVLCSSRAWAIPSSPVLSTVVAGMRIFVFWSTGDGSMLSKVGADRGFAVEDMGVVNVAQGLQIQCGLCHENELEEAGGD
ncbi:MAG: hypothetical protein U5R49_15420 [Deltaproteobacteria bacterium]|nr:hypothetical protein [Deltaproteobacteria bacterium]